MKHLLTIISCLLALNLTAQEVVVEYPYNPDFENDGNVGVEDLMQLLASFGMGFDVDELTIDEVALSDWLQAISETLVAQQALIDSLMSNEANSGMGQLDSALIAEMINEAGSATASFGERVHLAEPADWGPLPWDDYVNYGTYQFNQAGIFFCRFQYPFYSVHLLPDSVEMSDVSVDEFHENFNMGSATNEAVSIPVRPDERLVIKGLPEAFAANDNYNFDWVPFATQSNSSFQNSSSDTLIIDISNQCSSWYGNPIAFAAEKPFVRFIGDPSSNECYFELEAPNDSVPDVVIFNASESIIRGGTFTGGNYMVSNEWIHLRAVGDQWFKPWYDH